MLFSPTIGAAITAGYWFLWVKGGGYGLIGDIIVGIVGALIAGWLLPQIGIIIGGGIIGAIINAFIGAVILLIIMRLIKR
jgi:uncharacterized membrane protein YeaQ/YmgE (transglycosylase-associated protein family)